jgi:DNA-binding NtrC family response regulator
VLTPRARNRDLVPRVNSLKREPVNNNPTTPPARLPAFLPSVLVVEDEILVRMLVSDELRAADYLVLEAVDADEAVAMLRAGVRVDLILSDVRMPGSIDGMGLLRFSRENYPGIPVIITSGHLSATEACAEGATRFLPKPYRLSDALQAVKAGLSAPQ